jgi:hypothetical protein
VDRKPGVYIEVEEIVWLGVEQFSHGQQQWRADDQDDLSYPLKSE